jgi:type II secretion system protein N
MAEAGTSSGAWKAGLLWVAAGIGLLVLSVLATFPYDALHARVLAELRRSTGMDVRVAEWAVGMPLQLEWRNVTFARLPWDPVRVAFLGTKFRLFHALTGGLGMDVVLHQDEARPQVGTAKASVTAGSWTMNGPVSLKGQVLQLDLPRVAGRYVSHGVLNGDFVHRLDMSQATVKGDGSWKAEVKDLVLDNIPLMTGRMLALSFTRVTAGLSCRDEVCDITELKGEGLDGSFTGTGAVTLQQPLGRSHVAVTVTIVPGAGFAAKAATLGLPALPPGTPLTVKLAGTLAQPTVTL